MRIAAEAATAFFALACMARPMVGQRLALGTLAGAHGVYHLARRVEPAPGGTSLAFTVPDDPPFVRPYADVMITTAGVPRAPAGLRVALYEDGRLLGESDRCYCCVAEWADRCDVRVGANLARGRRHDLELVIEPQKSSARGASVSLDLQVFEPYE